MKTAAYFVVVFAALVSLAAADSAANLSPGFTMCGFTLDYALQLKYPWARPRPGDNIDFCESVTRFTEEGDYFRSTAEEAPVVFYGASEVGCFRWEWYACTGTPEIFQEHFGAYNPRVWAVGFDSTHTLMWRLLAARHAPTGTGTKVSVLNIGGNDLSIWATTDINTFYKAGEVVANQILQVGDVLTETNPNQIVVITGILPRGSDKYAPSNNLWPNWVSNTILEINARVKYGVEQRWLATHGMSNIWFVDCADVLINPNGVNLIYGLVDDGIHPTGQGWELIFEKCLDSAVYFALEAAEDIAYGYQWRWTSNGTWTSNDTWVSNSTGAFEV